MGYQIGQPQAEKLQPEKLSKSRRIRAHQDKGNKIWRVGADRKVDKATKKKVADEAA